MKKILIVDSGMSSLGGHNFSYTRAVQDGLAEMGYVTDVLANKFLPADLAQSAGYKPAFAHGAYDFPPTKKIQQVLAHIYAQSVIFTDELERELENKISDYAAIFSHTIGDFELIGWNRFLSRHRLDAQLLLLMRSTHDIQKLSRIKRTFHPYFRIKPHYLNAIHSKLKAQFTLLTDSELLTNEYATAYKHKILTLPIPINKYFLADENDYRTSLDEFKSRYGLTAKKGLCIGYMGDARKTKGFHLLAGLICDVLAKTDDVHFLIQCPKAASGKDDSSLEPEVSKLSEIERTAGVRLKLVSERLNEEDYANMFRSLDIVLIPYLLPGYTEATSGIFAEAVALGKPTIVTEKTWMAHELKKFEGGLEIKSNDSEDLSNKVFKLLEQYPAFSAKAHDYRAKWCEFHNLHTLAEMLIKEIK